MDSHVKALYERGDTSGLMAIALHPDEPAHVVGDAYRALRLLARLGDQAATAFCDATARVPGCRYDAA